MYALLVGLTIAGWLIFAFAVPGMVAGIFFVLGTAEPWGLMVPVLVALFGWILTRLDFKEKGWGKTLGILITCLAVSAIFIACLIVTRNDSLTLAIWGVIPAAFIALGGVVLTILSPEKGGGGRRILARLPRP